MEGGSFSWGGQRRGWWDPRAVGGSDRPPSPGRWEQGKPQQPWPGGPSSSSSAWQEALGGKGVGGDGVCEEPTAAPAASGGIHPAVGTSHGRVHPTMGGCVTRITLVCVGRPMQMV